MSDKEATIMLCIMLLGVCIVGGTLWYTASVAGACLERGWVGSRVVITRRGLQPYCTARIDQTDVVKPLVEAEKR